MLECVAAKEMYDSIVGRHLQANRANERSNENEKEEELMNERTNATECDFQGEKTAKNTLMKCSFFDRTSAWRCESTASPHMCLSALFLTLSVTNCLFWYIQNTNLLHGTESLCVSAWARALFWVLLLVYMFHLFFSVSITAKKKRLRFGSWCFIFRPSLSFLSRTLTVAIDWLLCFRCFPSHFNLCVCVCVFMLQSSWSFNWNRIFACVCVLESLVLVPLLLPSVFMGAFAITRFSVSIFIFHETKPNNKMKKKTTN